MSVRGDNDNSKASGNDEDNKAPSALDARDRSRSARGRDNNENPTSGLSLETGENERLGRDAASTVDADGRQTRRRSPRVPRNSIRGSNNFVIGSNTISGDNNVAIAVFIQPDANASYSEQMKSMTGLLKTGLVKTQKAKAKKYGQKKASAGKGRQGK